MEEKRKKFGMELLPTLHKRLKQTALNRDVPLWRATQDAVLGFLEPEADKSAPRQFSPEHLSWHEKLEFVLLNGDTEDLTGIKRNLDWAENAIRSRAAKTGGHRKAS